MDELRAKLKAKTDDYNRVLSARDNVSSKLNDAQATISILRLENDLLRVENYKLRRSPQTPGTGVGAGVTPFGPGGGALASPLSRRGSDEQGDEFPSSSGTSGQEPSGGVGRRWAVDLGLTLDQWDIARETSPSKDSHSTATASTVRADSPTAGSTLAHGTVTTGEGTGSVMPSPRPPFVRHASAGQGLKSGHHRHTISEPMLGRKVSCRAAAVCGFWPFVFSRRPQRSAFLVRQRLHSFADWCMVNAICCHTVL